MGITFDHVEGVVQKASEPAPAAQPGVTEGTAKPTQESYDDMRRRMERMSRRLHAD